jgi:hypothetical protein
MTTNQYVTKHLGFAAFVRYVLGDDSHLSTRKEDTGFSLTFDDPDRRCSELQTAFFSQEGAIVGDARALLDCSRDIAYSIVEAKRYGSWECLP